MVVQCKKWVAIVAVVVVAITLVAASEKKQEELPDAVVRGLEAYRVYHSEAAVTAWVRDSMLAGSEEAAAALTVLRQADAKYGKYLSNHVLYKKTLTPSTVLCYLSLEFDRGPAFCKLLAYKTKIQWVVVQIQCDMDPTRLLPPEFWFD